MKIIVTGGTGFVGINIVRFLAQAGHEVLSVSRHGIVDDPACKRFLADVKESVSFEIADIGEDESLTTLFATYKPAQVVHAAAITPTREVERAHPNHVVNVNLLGTLRVLEAARLARVKRVVYVSSAAVYGDMDESNEITEETPSNPKGLYAISKDASEKLCAHYEAIHRIETVALRVGWVYGPLERLMDGSSWEMSIVYHFVQHALRDQEIRIAHLDPRRDWIYARDLAAAIAAVLEQGAIKSRCYNVSGGQGYTHRELLDTISRILPLRYRLVNAAEANVPAHLTRARRGPTSIQRLVRDTSYRPQMSLEHGLRSYIDWVRAGIAATK